MTEGFAHRSHCCWRAKHGKHGTGRYHPPPTPSLVKPYLFRYSCLFGSIKPDPFLRLAPKVQLSEFPIWLHRLTCPIRTYQLLLILTQTSPFSPLRTTPAVPFAGVSARFRFSHLASLSCLIKDCWKLVFGCGLHPVQCPERCTPSAVPVIGHLKQANPI